MPFLYILPTGNPGDAIAAFPELAAANGCFGLIGSSGAETE